MEKKYQDNQEERIGSLLRAGKPAADGGDDFVRGVMNRIDALDAAPAFPPLLWAVPAVLVACLAVSLAFNLRNNDAAESAAVEEMLLIGLPAETQSLLTRSPSFTNVLWNNAQGGILP